MGTHCYFSIVVLWGCVLYLSSFHGVLSTYFDIRGLTNSSHILAQSSNTCASNILYLREENNRLQQELDDFKHKNTALQLHVNSLSGQCGSAKRCQSEGIFYADGDVWYPDPCTTCRCEIDSINCYTSFHSSYCELQCNENTCLNGGVCMGSLGDHSVQCSCPDGFSGPLCEQSVTGCVPIQTDDHCNHTQPLWYFDSYSNQCKSTVSGCFELSSIFPTFEACSLSCLQGTCCYRMKIGEISDMICQAETMKNCQVLCQDENIEVLGFYPGIKCPNEGCAMIASKVCHTGISLYSPGSKFFFGCDSCECFDEHISCSCQTVNIRREIRELSYSERIQYQEAISYLQIGVDNSVWTSLRNLYVTHIMHANSPQYFLFWNRNFLRTMERHLQELNCSITIPYFDFTLDAGNLASSVVWRSDFFGSLTENGSYCQRYTISKSGIPWTPCIKRAVRSNNNVPTMVDVALALSKTDFFEFTSMLHGIANHIHGFIGGDMATTSSPHDPIFFSLHAYIDLLFWQWERRYANQNLEKYKNEILNANLVPFNVKQKFLVNSERNLCVSYATTDESDKDRDQYGPTNIYGNDFSECFSDSFDSFSESPCDAKMKAMVNTGHRIQSVLYNQEENFLKTLPRTCLSSQDFPETSMNHMWNVQPDHFEMQSNFQPIDIKSEWCEQFCFTADIFLPPTLNDSSEILCSSSNQVEIPICEESALLKCPYYTYAPCRLSLCGNCTMICHINNEDIECKDPKIDFCSPNPCKNGGICMPSEWPSLPHLVFCDCLPGFEGQHCEQESTQRCSLPQHPGKLINTCGTSQKRWYFDAQKQECFSFMYQGCSGNANNFPSYYECRTACIIGACCSRRPQRAGRAPGFNSAGYDRYGFTAEGKSLKNEMRTIENGYGGDKRIFRYQNFDYQGYNKNGYTKNGIDRYGYDKNGYHHATMFNLTGYNKFGTHDGDIDFDEFGYNKEGFNRAGLDCSGRTKDGWDYYGLSSGWSYECKAMSLKDCQNIEKEPASSLQQVIAFSPGKKCEEIFCGEQCGCSFFQKSLSVGMKFGLGCGTCECTTSGRVSCPCTTISIRKEVRDMTSEEWKRYQDAIKVLAMTSAWQNLTNIYREFVPQTHGNLFFLPWHRFFLRYSEMKLQEIDCSVTIPYFDWTLDVGQLETSVVWQTNMFGGNGDKSRNNCVMKHPFKNYFPSYWANCLRRDFNSSVFLPNAIDLEFFLRIQTFEEFSLQMDTISGLFHLFVGGHMATVDSSYDPIFFSHYAFIDKIWNDWITAYPNNVQKFLQTIRYVPLVPFSIVSDNVLLSEIQLCVNYKDITEGAPCVDGSKYNQLNFNTAEVQSKGFDVTGYDTEGYDSFGYDQMGWRKDGIFRDSFNRDGFDVNGYDRKGFNRYGFDRRGCNSKGICMSESLHILNGNMSNSPWFEFDLFGFGSSGFDFHGYDAYGFDANGFDRNNCSYFFNGPFYPIFMKNARMQMKTLSLNELNDIKRTCDFVTNLPKWWLNLYWLNRNSRYNLHLEQAEGHLYSPFAGSKYLWIPPVPEERFCFQLHHHSKCELNKPPVPCPFSTCNSQICPTLPSAQCRDFGCGSCDRNFFNVISQKAVSCNTDDCISLDGNVKSNGEEWGEESCYTCSCQAGFVSCSSENCDTSCDHPVVVPSSCCPVCDGCMKDTVLYSNGEPFIDPQNPCLNCTCKGGSILCTTVECAPMKPCMKSALVTLHGECCPTCSMCGPHIEGSYWMESPCHNCTCDTGNVYCKVIECDMPDCQYPARTNGECCRHCNDCEYRGSYVKNEEIFNLENCIACKCQKGNISCKKIDCSHSICKDTGYEFNPCCDTCKKGCQYDGKDYEDGNLFNPSFNPCLNCSCGKGLVRCQPVKCPDPEDTCEIPVFPPGGCCPVCPKCTFYGRVYTNGQRWKISNDSCETCVCLNGIASCSEKESCPNQKCTHGVVPAGQCCSPCTDCKYNDHVVPDNMQFSPPDDSCARCICQKGNITCVREACPRLLCQATELPPGACCPVCKGCFNSLGQPVQHGHKWVHHSDICQVCTCENSITKCERIVCKIPCTHPIKRHDVCCPECNGCLVSGNVYQNNAEIPTSDPCRRCYCYNGNMDCQSVSCPQMTCANPIKEPESCCYICEECNFQGHTYKNGTKFQPSSEPCYTCTCDKGAVYCERRDHHCNPQCTDPVKIPGQCCPICDGCEYEGSILRNKEHFTPNPEEPCLQCECTNGNVKCFQQTCPKLSCLNTVRPENQCCEECLQYCVDESRKEKIYQEGEVWMSLTNECDVCTCKDSIVQCERMPCKATHCQHPAAPFGVCCPKCDHCEFTHRLYRNGQEFSHEDDPCQICKCENGTVSCQTIICDPLPCMHPEELKGLCCPICSPEVKCHQAGKTYDAWENFLDPRNPCSECVCVDGMSSCHPVLCLNPECPNPQFGHCCDSCDGCSYGEKNYINHVTFHDPQNQCRDCQCQSGVVSCQQTYCPPTDCENPIYMEGNCCPVCRDCKYKGSFYRDGESFSDPEDDCSECYCQYPEVNCQRRSCSETSCIDEVTTRCRDGIADCYFFDETHESGTVFTHPDNPCEICSCQNGMVTCFEQHCPFIRCTYPVHMNCCSVCSEGCMINGTLYKEGQPIQDSPNSCQECVCKNGNMTCKPKQCPPVNCKKPSTEGCCPVCKDCIFNNENIKNGQEVISPDACQICLCINGNIECKSKPCEVIHCTHPIVKDCCPSCGFGCSFNGKTYQSGEEITNPEKPCESCKCEKGNMKCVLKQCLKTDCLNPAMKDCCPICDSGCVVEEQFYELNARIDYHNRPCDLCTCLAGTVVCTPKPCDSAHCSHPIMKNCCPVCDSGCMSGGQFYELNANIDYHNRPCEVCTCLAGSIVCYPKPCESTHCSHPIMKNCCPVCDSGCLNDRKVFADSETFIDPANTCETCTCTNGNIECKPKTCDTVYCLNPVVEDCCPVCDLGCLYQETVYHFGAEFDDPTDSCSECACMEGSILCDRKPCDPVDCKNVITDEHTCCPYCPDHCNYNGKRQELATRFPHETDPCQECICLNGDIHCEKKICSANKCLHPAPGRCCLECLNCLFHEEIYTDNTNFTNTEDACETCLCSKGQVVCERNSCVQCLHPILKDFNCCPLCDGCFYGGMNITNQQRFISPENPCDECICKSGTVTCHKLSCSLLSCANPVVPPGVCCPVCPGCVVSGTHFNENEDFDHPDDVCNKCICKDGHIACKRQICERNCTHPIPDPCCPICNGCMFERINYVNNQRFNPDSCRSCECKEGNVKCTSEICPKLNCQLKVRLPGQCCETCRGCVYEGNEYENNATWVPSSNPCLSCKCKGGSVSCINIVCPVECVEPVPVPGFCCPICPDCEQDGLKYKSGQRFSPLSRPCDTCTCDSGHVFCIRHECPVLIDCPEESVKPPGIGECCPTCAAFGSSCTRDQIGHLYHPYPDPCFACQCSENFMWICSKEFCPPLNCPPEELIRNDKECCPKCKVCITEGLEHLHGDLWFMPNDPCNQCFCDFGFIKCSRINCPTISCEAGMTEFRFPGECCDVCTSSTELSCDYGRAFYKNGQSWKPDPCTTCLCTQGKMHCQNERCIPLDCTSDEIPSVDPGQCCPKCIPRPATCLAFGDPHYRTFDGASISFQGTCRYVLTADCSTQKFSIMVENNDRGFNGVSWTHRVVVVLQNASVDLRAGPTVYVRGKFIENLPYFENPILYVEKTGPSVLVTTDVGVQVLWNGDGYVEVTVSGVYRGKTCGLCGNFNNFPEDDMRTPSNQTVTSEAKFGNSWKYGEVQPSGCTESVDIDPCSKGGYRIRKIANTKCSILKQTLFAPCHRLIPPEPFFAACVYDVCACSENDDCLCDILSTYSQECSKAGVILNWRSEGLCGIHCSEIEGLVFDECGPPCQRTCENINLPMGILASQCFKPCVPGCQCSADKVLHNGRCIRPELCP